jgi:hypothetical protein
MLQTISNLGDMLWLECCCEKRIYVTDRRKCNLNVGKGVVIYITRVHIINL